MQIDEGKLRGDLRAANPGADPGLIAAVTLAMVRAGKVAVLNYEIQNRSMPNARTTEVRRAVLPIATANTADPRPRRITKQDAVSRTLGTSQSAEEFAALQELMAARRSVNAEDAILGPKEAAARLGVTRITLNDWRKRGDVLALPKGKKFHAIPMGQFVGGRPASGMRELLFISSGRPASLWLWLCTRHTDFNGLNPLEALTCGRTDEVVAAAKRRFT